MKTVGSNYPGGFLTVRAFENEGRKSVMLVCDGGNVRYQQNMTPNQARQLAGYLQDMANESEEEQVIQYETDGAGV